MPQAIAHRGYKAKHPENTMGAFRGAVQAKAHAIETDIHLTKDDVVVLSHVSVKMERLYSDRLIKNVRKQRSNDVLAKMRRS